MSYMKFNPINGNLLTLESVDPADWRPVAGTPTSIADAHIWRYNPWTGQRRAAPDVKDDPFGICCVSPSEPLRPAERRTAEMPEGQDVVIDRRNPKSVEAKGRVPLALLSPVAKAAWAMAQFLGKTKYGAWNWRATEVLASEYVSAAQRHLDAWMSGETFDPADGTHHLGNTMACCAILLDAAAAGKLIDDRPPRVDHRPMYAECEAMVAPIEAKYKDREVVHYTIAHRVAPATLVTPSNTQGESHEPAASRDALAGPAAVARRESGEAGAEKA